MKARRLAIGALAGVGLAAWLFFPGVAEHSPVPPGAADPAFEYYTSAHGASYAAIDRWAHYGMRGERFIAVVEGSGYRCEWQPATTDAASTGTIRTILCRKPVQWPLERTLSIQAGFEHSVVDRLAWATAKSTPGPGGSWLSVRLSAALRKAGWMEPEVLQVKGFQIDSIDTLTRMVADGMATTGWHDSCTEGQLAEHCGQAARERAASGYPALPAGPLPVGAALDLQRMMERLRFAPPMARGADDEAEDSLPVRVADGRMWLDFASRDLGGNRLSASVELASEGGTPVRLVTSLNGASQSLPLKGTPRRANDDSMVYLLPKNGADATRPSVWLNLPHPQYPGTMDRLAQNLPLIDAAFIGPMAKALFVHAAADSGPEEALGLYPALRVMEQQAEHFRALQPGRWLPRENGHRLIALAFRDQPETRAAWMFAICEPVDAPGSLDRACVQRFMITDPDVARLVRHEIAQQQMLYLNLPENHPIRIRLGYLAEAFSSDQHDDSTAAGS